MYLIIGRSIFIFGILLSMASATLGQGQDIPVSKLIDAKQLLRDVEVLAADDMEGRSAGTRGGTKAREYVVERFKQAGLKGFAADYLQPFVQVGRDKTEWTGANVVGYLKGKKHPDKYIIVSAHYDHVGIIKGEIYNGADDDASGTSALFALAAYFKKNQPDSSLIFAAFDAEEKGLVGSRKFVAEPPVELTSILLNVNLDMIGQNDKGELYASGTYHSRFLRPYIEKVVATANVKLLVGHDRPEQKRDDWTFQSDHGSFHRQKVPFIYFGVEDHKDYHKPTDDYPTITKAFYVRAVETILATIKELDKNAAKIAAERTGRK
ncbi:MAG: M28 family peptidase [Pyrinomonadaceae bacterium]